MVPLDGMRPRAICPDTAEGTARRWHRVGHTDGRYAPAGDVAPHSAVPTLETRWGELMSNRYLDVLACVLAGPGAPPKAFPREVSRRKEE